MVLVFQQTKHGLQLAPNGNIYGSGTPGSNIIYEITSTNTLTPTINTLNLKAGSTIYRGIDNISFLNPNLPIISSSNIASNGCKSYSFDYKFRTYFNDTITTILNSEVWDFGDGTPTVSGHKPTHTFTSIGTYLVKLTTTDNTCNHTWTDTIYISPNCPLPIELVTFDGEADLNKIKLNWVTALERNNDRFSIEHSIDGLNFKEIGSVKGSGDSHKLKYWSYYDLNPNIGINYYRLIQYDYDGTPTYSNIISINYDSNVTKIKATPNPFNNNINIEILSNSEEFKIQIFDITGKILDEFITESKNFTIGDGLNSGCYILKISNNSEYQSLKIIKK